MPVEAVSVARPGTQAAAAAFFEACAKARKKEKEAESAALKTGAEYDLYTPPGR